jgi:FtsH-binding integral membrane protein
MTPSYILVLMCSALSFLCAFLKQLYDAQYNPKTTYALIIDVILSGVSGLVLGLILTEYLKNELAIIGLSGLGGMFGVSALKILMKLKLGKKIKIQVGFDDDSTIHTHQNKYLEEHMKNDEHCNYTPNKKIRK